MTRMTIRIHRLTDDEWDTLRRHRLASLADAPGAFWATHDDEAAFSQDDWGRFVSGVAWLLATLADESVGLVGVMPADPDPTVEPQIIGMWVRPDARRQGVGAQLLDAARARVTDQGARSVALWVTDENPGARSFYEAYGFRPTGVSGALPPGRTGLEHELRLDLERG
jgi:GNAT superfamily N-acetyltransferase